MKGLTKEIVKPSWGENIVNAAGFTAIHLAWIGALWTGVTWRALWIAFALYWIRMFLITGVYHRYFSHRAYKMSRPLQFILAFLTTTSVQKGPLWWASRHVIHHKYSDIDAKDVHSPRQHGLLQAHIGWIWWNNKNIGTDMRYVKDWAKFPELHWLEKYHYIAPLLLTALCYYLDGWSGVVVGMGWSTIVFWHATFSVNSLAHVWGSQRYKTGDDSRNNWFLAIITLGEGWHNNHHHYDHSARQGFKWWEIDVTYYTLWLLARFRLIWNLEQVPESKIESDLVSEATAP
jgi:stearoyl-CoA desaturase (delta-9 desaturase)